MKRILLAAIALSLSVCGFTQTDTTKNEKADTIKIGGMVIIKRGDKSDTTRDRNITISNRNRDRKKNANVSTNWWIVDIGFANYSDDTDYGSAGAQAFAPGSNEEWFNLKTGKSVNVNIWLFMQRLNLIKHAVNFKYGLGIELNNYRFDDERVSLQKNPTLIVLDPALKDVKKNKLAADYVTVPLLLNFNFTPGRDKGFGFSGGVSGGYLYSSRQKIKRGDDRDKTHDDFNLRKWKLSYIGELNLGPIKLYGSYATKSMWEKGLDQTPYTVGLRLSNW
ncbi:MAG TPA: outer membrane beta-barrel protein [Chitinophagaceae bacterium]|nr:outer membrane beta-barrel protein [Chitinophagaceae bacterium]